ncbi:hypothetical protein P171DRAFT_46932 [Karstenula rhodostoma CBS 690.94]|uniref:Uncharacterized protein n=1 Tax=Karstenula rhodostoma CBS 690.94 TaxID=1392251 RepID=A0A9P4PGB9_9PLEO|nr:hypothetical protein P171DRAFT_46932 [Karstenula rhodostoma CBS 690.94]
MSRHAGRGRRRTALARKTRLLSPKASYLSQHAEHSQATMYSSPPKRPCDSPSPSRIHLSSLADFSCFIIATAQPRRNSECQTAACSHSSLSLTLGLSRSLVTLMVASLVSQDASPQCTYEETTNVLYRAAPLCHPVSYLAPR